MTEERKGDRTEGVGGSLYPEPDRRRDERDDMVDDLLSSGQIESDALEDAMRAVPRELFVPERATGKAYTDRPLPIGEGQTISAPHMVAMITERLDLSGGEKVLEVGTGRGYHAAVVAEIVGAENVYTVEYHNELAREARENLPGGTNVFVGDGSKGLRSEKPYDRIYLTCAAPEVPEFVDEQLRDGGRAVFPAGRRGRQRLTTVYKQNGETKVQRKESVRFVRLVGEEGF